MRPVSVQRDEREPAPRWKLAGTYVILAALCLTVVLVDEGQNWLAAAGVCASAIGAAFIVASTRRTMRENAGRRIPLLGRPPVEPRRVDLLDTFGQPMVLLGVVMALKSASVPWSVALPVVCIGVVGAPFAAQAWHNRRVRRASERLPG